MTIHDASSRRQFLQTATAGTALSLLAGQLAPSPAALADESGPRGGQRPLQLALASYSLRNFSLEQTLAMTQRIGLDAICLKSFHLPLEAQPGEITRAVEQVRAAGIRLYAGGVIAMNDESQVQQAFEYARAAGMQKIIGTPRPAMLPLVHDKVQEFDIQVCIHNHGPGDDIYPTPDVAYDRIKTLDKRIGLCHDVGHTVRFGRDPVAMSEACADRLLDVHIKDVTAATPAGHAIACGRGVINLPALLRTFIRLGYTGYLAFEYEEQPDDPLPGLAESVGYIRGVLDAL
ncbi:MAG: sugar phosphate isomerase/epimerase [Pirellulaceae bacterium]|jgi:sugar phosphate isomerase/epimerase|nr:sugar phosphate isomerase/epimerase [Pirellulaceae bacterium]